MAGVFFIVNVPKKEYENELKKMTARNLIINKEKYKNASKVIHELKEKPLGTKPVHSFSQDDDNGVIFKCRSTDCLHNNRETDPYKCKSESCLASAQPMSDQKSYLKSSWEEIKQVVKPRSNKLKISRPVRGADILQAFHLETPLETILLEVVERLDIKNAAWNSTKDNKFWQVTLSLESGNLCEELLQVLRTFGIGSRHQSSVSLLPCALYYQSNDGQSQLSSELGGVGSRGNETVSKTAWSRFSSSVRARNNLAQVLHDVRADAALTFDWLFLLLVAAFVAAIGLIENSTVILVASMLISPLMGPITAGTLGTAVKDRSLQLMGLKNEFLGLFLSLVMGFLFGLTICAIDERYGVVEDWPTYEMISRCEYRSLWVGILVAIPSGAGVALAVLGEYTASLVGVAISASLLPPAVNAGLLWAMAVTRLTSRTEELRWLVVLPSELAVLGTASLCLTLVNIVCIFLAGVAVYKVKEVSPLDGKDISWWKDNKGRFHVNKQSKNNDSWNSYTKWYNDQLEKKEQCVEENEKPSCPTPEQVPSETVTLRKQPSVIKRLRARNMNAFCHNKPLSDIYIPLNIETKVDLETPADETIEGNEIVYHNMIKETKENSNNDMNSGTTGNTITDINSDSYNSSKVENISTPNAEEHSYYNLGFQEDAIHILEYQTIEASPVCTEDPKKNGIVLDNNSHNV